MMSNQIVARQLNSIHNADSSRSNLTTTIDIQCQTTKESCHNSSRHVEQGISFA